MIIKQLRVRNFGPYASHQVFNLAPSCEGQYQRPLVMVTGKNGVGKTTVMEALRLCLHGSLAVGRSVSREVYRSHLESRIHRPAPGLQEPNGASVELALEYVFAGKKRHYEIRRSWIRSASGVTEKLEIAEDHIFLSHLESMEQKEAFLRELVPPCVSDLFFLDNEKLDSLSSDAASRGLLSEMVHSLLGLDIVHQLQRDLDVYLSRTTEGGSKELRRALEEAGADVQRLEDQVRDTDAELRDTAEQSQRLKGSIAAQEQRLAREGHGFAGRRGELRARAEQLQSEIQRQRAEIQELASGLMPFAVTPKYCQLTIERLEKESHAERTGLARELIEKAQALIARELSNPRLWDRKVSPPSGEACAEAAARLREGLMEALGCATEPSDDLLLHASDQDKALLTSWSRQSQDTVPRQFCKAVAVLRRLEKELAETESRLAEIPSQETMAPLVVKLNDLYRQLGELDAKTEVLQEQRRKQEFEHRQSTWRLRDARQKLEDSSKGQRRVDLALKTQKVLEAYGEQLLRHKLTLLEGAITSRFEELCRKPGFVTDISIDPATFALTLYRYGRPFDRSALSAGERQLLATAILWAMRDVSRLPIPVFTDTPVARLDADHREAMVEQFFPRVSHQTVLLATDAEAEALIEESLEPLLARTYQLEYDTTRGSTFARIGETRSEPELTPELDLVR